MVIGVRGYGDLLFFSSFFWFSFCSLDRETCTGVNRLILQFSLSHQTICMLSNNQINSYNLLDKKNNLLQNGISITFDDKCSAVKLILWILQVIKLLIFIVSMINSLIENIFSLCCTIKECILAA